MFLIVLSIIVMFRIIPDRRSEASWNHVWPPIRQLWLLSEKWEILLAKVSIQLPQEHPVRLQIQRTVRILLYLWGPNNKITQIETRAYVSHIVNSI